MQTEDGAAKDTPPPLEYDDRLMQRAFDQARQALGGNQVRQGASLSLVLSQ